MKSIDVSNWDISNITITHSMFRRCWVLEDIDISKWNSSKITNMDSMFEQCNNLSNASIHSIVNMCINAVSVFRKNLSNLNTYSPFYNSIIDNSYYEDMWSDLSNAGWNY